MGTVAADRTGDETSRLVAHIVAMDPSELDAGWARHCRGKPPAGLPRVLLARLLAYRVQAATHGDLSPPLQRFLERVSKELTAGNRAPNLLLDDALRLKPGTMLVREHGGEQHRVMVLAEGYAWNGQVHKSLSAVASAITGTRWNGHRFFGLDKRPAKEPAIPRGATSRGQRPDRSPTPEARSSGVSS